MMDYAAMGKRIRTRRKDKGITQAEMSKGIRVSTSFVGHIERGTRIASVETVLALSELLNVSVDWLLTGTHHTDDDTMDFSKNSSVATVVMNRVMRCLFDHVDEWAPPGAAE